MSFESASLQRGYEPLVSSCCVWVVSGASGVTGADLIALPTEVHRRPPVALVTCAQLLRQRDDFALCGHRLHTEASKRGQWGRRRQIPATTIGKPLNTTPGKLMTNSRRLRILSVDPGPQSVDQSIAYPTSGRWSETFFCRSLCRDAESLKDSQRTTAGWSPQPQPCTIVPHMAGPHHNPSHRSPTPHPHRQQLGTYPWGSGADYGRGECQLVSSSPLKKHVPAVAEASPSPHGPHTVRRNCQLGPCVSLVDTLCHNISFNGVAGTNSRRQTSTNHILHHLLQGTLISVHSPSARLCRKYPFSRSRCTLQVRGQRMDASGLGLKVPAPLGPGPALRACDGGATSVGTTSKG